jgi:hypothetical protein
VTVNELKRLCAQRGLFVVGSMYPGHRDGGGVVVRARSDNHRLKDLPEGLLVRPSGIAYTVIQIADGNIDR